jgi:glycosyltransferase involved in cell wall biosynthesis
MNAAQRPIVALVTDAIYPYHCGGKELRYHELASRLAEKADVHIYTMNWWAGSRTHRDGNITYHALCRVWPLYAGNRRSVIQAMFFAVGCLRLLWCRFDVIEADHMPYLQIPVLRLVTYLRRKRLVVTWHEVWGLRYWRQYLGLAGLAAWLMEWSVMHLPDEIVAASPETARRLRSFIGEQAAITVAPNGVDLDAIDSTDPDLAKTDFVVVGRLVLHKRVDMLLSALASLHAGGVPATCRIIGDGPERLALHSQADALGLGDAVDFRHDVREQKDVYALVKAAGVAVFPTEREGFGAAVLEALACGVAVVTTSAPDNLSQHLVARSSLGKICQPSVTELAAAMRDLSANLDRQNAQRDAWVDDCTWSSVAEQLARALRI